MKTKFLLVTFLTVMLTYAISVLAQLPPEARAGLWKAQWITSPSAPQPDHDVSQPAERIDGALFECIWNDPASRGKWEKAAPIGNASERGAVLQNNNWQWIPNSLPAMQMELTPVGSVVRASGIEPPANFPGAGFEIPAHATVSLLLDQS